MERRASVKFNLLVRAVWEGLGSAQPNAVVVDIDIQFYPGWAGLVGKCTAVAPLCLGQQEGLFARRSRLVNSGLFALRSDVTLLELMLDMMAHFEPQWSGHSNTASLDQDVVSQFLFQKGSGMYAFFNPGMVVNGLAAPLQVLSVKIHHACYSSTNHQEKLLYLARLQKIYYAMLPLCVTGDEFGPQHPCCVLYGYRRRPLESDLRELPAFVAGNFFGFAGANRSAHRRVRGWNNRCHEIMIEREFFWQQDNPFTEFTQEYRMLDHSFSKCRDC